MTAPTDRASVLCVGYRRRPFSIHVQFKYIQTVALQLGVEEYQYTWMRYCNPDERTVDGIRWSLSDKSAFHMRLFKAVWADTGEYLRLSDNHTTALMRIEEQRNVNKLLAMYLTHENDVTNYKGSYQRLAELLGVTQGSGDGDDDDRIHLLAVMVRDSEMPALPYSVLSLSHLALDYLFGASRGLCFWTKWEPS